MTPAYPSKNMSLRKIQYDDLSSDYRLRSLDALKSSIKRYGIQQPPTVLKGDGGLRLLHGRRRLTVLRSLGYSSVEAVVLPEAPASVLDVAEKGDGESLSSVKSRVKAYQRCRDAERVHTTPPVTPSLGVDDLSPWSRSRFEKEAFTETHAKVLLRLARMLFSHGDLAVWITGVLGDEQPLPLYHLIDHLSSRVGDARRGEKNYVSTSRLDKEAKAITCRVLLSHLQRMQDTDAEVFAYMLGERGLKFMGG